MFPIEIEIKIYKYYHELVFKNCLDDINIVSGILLNEQILKLNKELDYYSNRLIFPDFKVYMIHFVEVSSLIKYISILEKININKVIYPNCCYFFEFKKFQLRRDQFHYKDMSL